MFRNELAQLWEESLQDQDFRFELKAQAVAVQLASTVAASGMTQKELADKLGWKASRVSKVLHGASNLTLKTMFQVCEALGIDFDVHFGGRHHLNREVEVIRKKHRETDVLLRTALQLNQVSWQRFTQKKAASQISYETGNTVRVVC